MMNNRFIHNLLSASAQHFLLQQVLVRSMSVEERRVTVREERDLIKKPKAMITYIIHRYINVS